MPPCGSATCTNTFSTTVLSPRPPSVVFSAPSALQPLLPHSPGTPCAGVAPSRSFPRVFPQTSSACGDDGAPLRPPVPTSKSTARPLPFRSTFSSSTPPVSSTASPPPTSGPAPLYSASDVLTPFRQLPQLFRLRPRQHSWCLRTTQEVMATVQREPCPPPPELISTMASLVLAQSPPDSDSPPSLLRNAPTPLSLRHGLGDCGSAIIPPELWSGLGLQLQLPRHPACPTRPNAPSEALLTPLAHSGVIFRAHSQPAAPAFAIYKSAEKARLIVDFRRNNTLHPHRRPSIFPTSALFWPHVLLPSFSSS